EFFLRLFLAYEEGGDISPLQVRLVESRLLQSRNRAFRRNQAVGDSLDPTVLLLGARGNLPIWRDAPRAGRRSRSPEACGRRGGRAWWPPATGWGARAGRSRRR